MVSYSYPIRAIEESEVAAYMAVLDQAFHSHYPPEAMTEYERITFELDRSAAAFDGDEIVGTSCVYTYRLSVPGGMADAGGISAVSVLPTYRRRGIMSAMIGHLLTELAGRGEAIAALFASEPEIYGRFGFGCASEHLRLTIPHGDGRLLPPGPTAPGQPGAPRLRVTDPQKARAELAAVHATLAASRPGVVDRDDRWWTARLADPEWARDGMTPTRWLIAEDDSGPRGYASYAVKPEGGEDGIPASRLRIHELVANDPAATVALWTDLLTRDLIGDVRASGRPVDEPLLQLLAGRRRARVTMVDGLWVRLTNVPAALTQRRYARSLDVVIEVTDSLLPANAGRWRLQADDGGQATCEHTTRAADLTAPVRALGAAYLGGARLGALAAAGQLAEHRPGSVAELSTAMSWDPAPWCTMVF